MPDTMHTHDIHVALRSPFVSDCVYVLVSLMGRWVVAQHTTFALLLSTYLRLNRS